MAISIASLTTSLSSLSFSSQISQKPNTLSFSRSNSLSFPLSHPSKQPLTLRVSATVASPETTTTTTDLKKLVKSRLPGGFAAQTIHGTGRRKCAIARVVLQEGTGKVIINYRDAKLLPIATVLVLVPVQFSSFLRYIAGDLVPVPMKQEYLQGNPLWLQYVKVPLVTLGYESSYDVFVKAHGGGLAGQAQAISLGVARALLKVSQDHRIPLKREGLLTRDSRIVERKKVGLKKARKAPQFSKR
ncbi:30S ribosomal protein S9 [Populus alba x Populus x berolinensis]|nr:30S ribosomal protein S9 [Populus alba x Populus x berolinensis]